RPAAVALSARADRAVHARATGDAETAAAELAAAAELLQVAREGAAFRKRPKFVLGPEGRGWLARAEAESRRARIGTAEHRGDGEVLVALTSREREVLRLIAAGRSNREIASVLFIAPKTASVHVSNILGKLGAASRTEAAAIAHREGLVSQPSAR